MATLLPNDPEEVEKMDLPVAENVKKEIKMQPAVVQVVTTAPMVETQAKRLRTM